MSTLWDDIHHLRRRDERRSHAPEPARELLLAKVSEEANEALELYRRMRGWGTNGTVTATCEEVCDEVCAAIMAAMVALDCLAPDARVHWQRYLAHGADRARAENQAASPHNSST
ncbi:hypothetical protein C9F11_43290 (plasmid) [Streptomyces sp. YIM 121038]|uniref:hypothetical protein n=1 Tax=Streptomyces sp. YIM 121038 TaxID=2136401 RepID=UPI00111076F9|nr:hypothetical protein [Streptomyces sp. YIM 121038]QCX82238.1 hypothetical protein C9F11_43290 [Streptomyces sp. YIM 121038]